MTNQERDRMSQPSKKLTEVEALTKVTKILNQLTPEQRRKVLAFLASE